MFFEISSHLISCQIFKTFGIYFFEYFLSSFCFLLSFFFFAISIHVCSIMCWTAWTSVHPYVIFSFYFGKNTVFLLFDKFPKINHRQLSNAQNVCCFWLFVYFWSERRREGTLLEHGEKGFT